MSEKRDIYYLNILQPSMTMWKRCEFSGINHFWRVRNREINEREMFFNFSEISYRCVRCSIVSLLENFPQVSVQIAISSTDVNYENANKTAIIRFARNKTYIENINFIKHAKYENNIYLSSMRGRNHLSIHTGCCTPTWYSAV